MAILSLEEPYERYIKPLSPDERLRLLAMTAQDLAQPSAKPAEGHTRNIMDMHGLGAKPERSLLELEGLGADIWEGVDAQEYVNKLREEWDHRP